MHDQPLVSIIIPTHNRANLIGETLDSVLAQTYVNWECIVVDDGSMDETEELLHTYIAKDTRFQYYKRPDTHLPGGNGARNYGFALSKGKYIQWFDSDDLMYPNLLEVQLQNIFESHAQFSLCLYDLYNLKTDKFIVGKPQTLRDDFYFDYITRKLPANLPTIMFKKTVLEGLSLNEHLLKSQEYEFLQRFFRLNGSEGALLNDSLIKVIRHKESITEKHTSDKIASALDALLITKSELLKERPTYVNSELAILYLKTLYIAFTNRMTIVFYKYLSKSLNFGVLKGLLTMAYSGTLYILVNFFPIGNWNYKKIYNLYS